MAASTVASLWRKASRIALAGQSRLADNYRVL
jgi:hypothetical protein